MVETRLLLATAAGAFPISFGTAAGAFALRFHTALIWLAVRSLELLALKADDELEAEKEETASSLLVGGLSLLLGGTFMLGGTFTELKRLGAGK